MRESVVCVLQADSAQGLSVAGNQAVTVLSGGNVGIGTTNPGNALAVKSSVQGGGITIYRPNVSYNQAEVVIGVDSSGGSIALNNDGDTYTVLSATSNSYFKNYNVGIGITAPSEKLEVAGTVNATAFVGSGTALTGIPGASTAYGSATTNETVYVSNGGNVGIGTTNPGSTIQVVGTTNDLFESTGSWSNVIFSGSNVGTTGDGEGIWTFKNTGSGDGTRFYLEDANSQTNRLTFDFRSNTGNTQIIAGTSAGNVGIGTTNPVEKLDVNGDIKTSASGGFYSYFQNLGLTDIDSTAGRCTINFELTEELPNANSYLGVLKLLDNTYQQYSYDIMFLLTTNHRWDGSHGDAGLCIVQMAKQGAAEPWTGTVDIVSYAVAADGTNYSPYVSVGSSAKGIDDNDLTISAISIVVQSTDSGDVYRNAAISLTNMGF